MMIHLVTGGSGSGKSSYAEEQIVKENRRYDAPFFYVATMIPRGEETKEKIKRHQMQRLDLGFLTIEKYVDLEELKIPDNAGILLECVSNLTANELYREDKQSERSGKEESDSGGLTSGVYDRAYRAVINGVQQLSRQTEHLVIVTNEVHSDVNGYSRETESYRKLLGKINCELAKRADQVTEVVYGIPMEIKR